MDYNQRAVGTVACPFCASSVGEPCKGVRGTMKGTHTDRRRAATKLLRETPVNTLQGWAEIIERSGKQPMEGRLTDKDHVEAFTQLSCAYCGTVSAAYHYRGEGQDAPWIRVDTGWLLRAYHKPGLGAIMLAVCSLDCARKLDEKGGIDWWLSGRA